MNRILNYPTYKPPGVKWLGDVPAHWEVRRLRNVAEMRASNVDKYVKEDEISVRLCNYVDVYNNDYINEQMNFMQATATDEEIKRFRLEKDDVLITKDSETWDDIGVPALVTKPATDLISGYHLALLRPRTDELAGGYLLRALQSKGLAYQFHIEAKGVTRYGLSQAGIKSVWLPLPPLPEQTAIVRFLDHADRRIRRYIRAKQKLIALLEEQKQAIIHRTVTHGLDSNVRLKPSGIEGLGDVPAHWEVVALGYLATKFGSGVTPRGGATVYQETGIPFLRSQNIHFDGLHLGGVARITPRLHQSLSNTHVKPGDVLLNITGASIGRVCSVPDHFSEGNVSQHVCIIRPKKNRLLSGFLASFLSTAFMQREIRFEQNGASREGLTLHSIRNFKIVLPTISEQQHILAEIRAHTERLAAAVTATRRQIALLQEHRTRLIADVVTGKLDVREAAAELPELDPLAEDDLDSTIHDRENSNLGELDAEESAEGYTIAKEMPL